MVAWETKNFQNFFLVIPLVYISFRKIHHEAIQAFTLQL